MKFSIGDKVLLKRTGEEGVVVALIGKAMMEVAVNGIHFPVYTDEVDHPYLKWFTEQKKPQPRAAVRDIPAEPARERPARLVQGIYLSFMPVYVPDIMEDIVSHIRISLLNETASPLTFIYDAKHARGRGLFHHQGSLHAFGHIYLHSLSLEEMNDQPRFHWQLSDQAAQLPASSNKGLLRIKPARLFGQLHDLLQSGAPSFNYLLADDAAQLTRPSGSIPAPPPGATGTITAAPAAWQPRDVLDLHIETLTDHAEVLLPAAMLRLQLDTLQYQLDMAIAHGQEQMVIIHGIGTGALRDAVHGALAEKAGVAYFKNEWNGRYGYGATVVTFKRR